MLKEARTAAGLSREEAAWRLHIATDGDDADNIFMKVLSKYSINETCKRLGIKAFVRTVAPGEAKIYVTGKKEKIQEFEQWVKNKTPAGSIINVVKLPLIAFYVLRVICR